MPPHSYDVSADGPAHRVVLADCLGPEGLATLPDKSVDAVLTDPPYEAEAHTKGRRIHNPRTGECRMAPLGFAPMTAEGRDAAAAQMARVAKRWIVVFCQIEASHLWRAALEAGGARYVRTMVWVKPNGQPQLTGDRPGVGFETMVVAYGTAGRMRWNGGGKRGWLEHCVDANFSREPRHHETQKPLPLMEELTRDFTDPGELICDPFAGSGTTGVACRRLGRRFIGFERDAKYHAIAEKRIAGAREQLRFFDGTGT
jgi:site-specific DNA-methyltransferase (adenine-specific)